MRLADVTLIPAALAIVAVSSYRLASEFLTPSLELLLGICAGIGVLVFELNPSLLLIAGGAIGAVVLRPREPRDGR